MGTQNFFEAPKSEPDLALALRKAAVGQWAGSSSRHGVELCPTVLFLLLTGMSTLFGGWLGASDRTRREFEA